MKVACCCLLLLLLTAVQGFQQPNLASYQLSSLKAAPKNKDYEYATQDEESSASTSFSMDSFKMPANFKMPENFQVPDNIKMPDLSNVMASFSEGEFGSRGEIYVAAQAVFILAIVFGGNLPFLDVLLAVSGPALLLGGLAVAALSVSDLGDGLTPFTTPTSKGSLKTTGVYAYVRHPMYAGLLSTMAGFSLISDSATRLLLTAMLFAVLNAKTDKEEIELQKMYPGEFPLYQQTVTGKFFPNELWEQVIKPDSDSGSKMSP